MDDQRLIDGAYRSGRDHPSTNLPPPHPPLPLSQPTLKIDDQSLTGGMYRSRRDYQSTNFSPPSSPVHLPQQPLLNQPPLQSPQLVQKKSQNSYPYAIKPSSL